MRTLVIGDIHGALKALEQVFERAKVDLSSDRLIFLGDLVDGWSDVAWLVRCLVEIREQTAGKPNEAVFLRGNHDDWCWNWLECGNKRTTWLSNGGDSTIRHMEAHFEYHPGDRSRFLEFFRAQESYYVDGQNRCFVHAGYDSNEGCQHDKYDYEYMWDRSLVRSAMKYKGQRDYLLEMVGEGKADVGRLDTLEVPARLKAHKEIFVGHTPTTSWRVEQPINAANLWAVDTGAGWRGRLTIMDVDSKKYWQSDPVRELYDREMPFGG